MNTIEKQELIAELINNGEKDDAVKKLVEWAENDSFKNVIFNILDPLLVRWGKLWMQGKLSLAHGYLSGKVAEELFFKATQSKEFALKDFQTKGTIILGNIEDDFHPLGRKLVNIFSQANGWHIIDLGNDVTAETFVNEAIENQAHIIAVSAMMFTTAKNIEKVKTLLEKEKMAGKIQLAVGGAVFKIRPELVNEVGGDGTAPSAMAAPELFDKLYKKSMQCYL